MATAKKKKSQRPAKVDPMQRRFVREVGAALLKMRKSAGLTEDQVAQLVGSSQSIIWRQERAVPGLRTPDFDRLRRLGAAMGWHMKVVFTEPAKGAPFVEVQPPSAKRKRIVPPPPRVRVQPESDLFYEPPGAW
jgi:transcriptional regulator with XRE-family HTH domain